MRPNVVLSSLLLLLSGLVLPLGAQAYHPALDEDVLPVPLSMRPAVEFWHDIFARYDDNHIVIHDDRHLELVYEVVDVTDLPTTRLGDIARARERTRRVREAIDRTRAALRVLSGDRRVRVPDEVLERVRILTEPYDADRSWYRSAVSRVRSQTGLRDEFANAIQISGMFMPGIEQALAEEGIPSQIKCLPFVESMFNYRARSKVGASGAWQFTRSTGRLYLRIDSAVDERSDVLRAAHGAAKYLKANYRRVESWPLALTGYNHGIGGMVRAARTLGTKDMGVIVDRYQSRSFGFASRNFYASFIAAVVVYEDREELFPGIEPLPALEFEGFTPERYISLLDLAVLAEIEEEQLVELNPALTRPVAEGDLLVPAEFTLRVPPGTLTRTLNAYELIPEDRKLTRQLARTHRVRRGETVGQIARRYGSSTRAIQQANGLPRADRIYVGQLLEIPTSGGGGTHWTRRLSQERIARIKNPQPASQNEPAVRAHIVQAGETLSLIADRYGVEVERLVVVNGLRSPDTLRVGQRINIPGSEEMMDRSYVVRAGDTLARIASAFDTTVGAIQRANSLSSTLIRVGQILTIP